MEEINYKELKVNGIYKVKIDRSEYLVKLTKIKENYDTEGPYITFTGKTFYPSSEFTNISRSDAKFYSSDDEEQRWFNHCVKLGHYINKNETPVPDQDILDLEKLIEESNKYL